MKKTLISLFCAICLISAADAQTKKSPVVFDAYEWNFGTVDSANGTVSHTFTFTNNPRKLSRSTETSQAVTASKLSMTT